MEKAKLLPQVVVDTILTRHGAGESCTELAREFGVRPGNIYNWIVRKKRKEEKKKTKSNKSLPLAKAKQEAVIPVVVTKADDNNAIRTPTIKERMQMLTNDYHEKLKALIMQEIMNNLKGI